MSGHSLAERQAEQQARRQRKSTFAWQSLFFVLVMALASAVRGQDKTFPDARYRDQENSNGLFLVLVAGLGQEKTWAPLTALIEKDKDLRFIDYLVYYAQREYDLEQNVNRLQTILDELQVRTAKHPQRIYVGHSLGGLMIRRVVLKALNPVRTTTKATNTQRLPVNLPTMVVTFGTPFDTPKFDLRMYWLAAAKFSYPWSSPFVKEVLNDRRVEEINTAWRRTEPIQKIPQANVFGRSDGIAPTAKEDPNVSIFIDGDHQTIVPTARDDCPFKILEALIQSQKIDAARGLRCVAESRR